MGNLLVILLVLFVSLAVIVKVAEKYAKPMEDEQQRKLSRIAMILIMALMVLGLLRHMMG